MLVTGTLKFFGLTKDEKRAILTGEWDDENNPKKQYVTVNEAKTLFTNNAVQRDGVWEDSGAAKFKVLGQVTLSLDKEFTKRGERNVCETTIHIGQPLGANPSVRNPAPKRPRTTRPRSGAVEQAGRG